MTVPIRTQILQPAVPTLSTSPSFSEERPQDHAAVDALIDAAFGPGRFTKAAERLREGRRPVLALSFTAWDQDVLVGCVRQWTIRVGPREVIFLGPIVVDPAWRHHGLGAALIERACEAVWAAGHDLILLVGEPPFFGPLGFEQVPLGQIIMPGPVDPRRVLARGPHPGAAQTLNGVVRPG